MLKKRKPKAKPKASEWNVSKDVWRDPKDYSRVVDGEVYLPFGTVCEMLDRTRIAIRTWYDWWESLADAERQAYPHPLPPYRRDFTSRGDRFWKRSDIAKLKVFRDNLEFGTFHEFKQKRREQKKREETE